MDAAIAALMEELGRAAVAAAAVLAQTPTARKNAALAAAAAAVRRQCAAILAANERDLARGAPGAAERGAASTGCSLDEPRVAAIAASSRK